MAWRALVCIAYFSDTVHIVKPLGTHIVDIIGDKASAENILIPAYNYLVRPRSYLRHEHMMSHGKPKASSLSYSVMRYSLVGSQNIAVFIHKIAFRHLNSRCPFNVRCMVIVRDKAYLLAIRLVRHQQPDICSNLPYLWLSIIATRHKRVCKLFLRKIVQRIGLILSVRNRR